MEYILNTHQKSAYLELCKHPSISIAELSRITGIHRPQLYVILDELIEQGLVEKKPLGKRLVYTKTTRQNLESVVKQSINKAQDEAAQIMTQAFGQDGITMITSKEDILNMYDDLTESLSQHEAYYSVTTVTADYPIDEYLPKTFRRIREEKNLLSYVITNYDLKRPVRFSLEIKHASDWNDLEKNCMWLIYGKKFVFVDYERHYGYIITDARLASFQKGLLRKMFDLTPFVPATSTKQ